MKFTARVSVFGGREISSEIYSETVELGRLLGKENYLVFCGGGEGVMEAIAKGVSQTGGVCIGILKSKDFTTGNSYLSIPVSTNLGIGRNALLAYNCDVAVAVNGQYGTLSEIAYALQLDKPVIGYKSWDIKGYDSVDTIAEIMKFIHQFENGKN